MLVPLTRATFEEIIPLIATGPQYTHYWGKPKDVLRRLLISVVAVVSALLLVQLIAGGSNELKLIFCTMAGLYWLWGPVFLASRRNANCRKLFYSGFWRGRVLEVFLTEELIGEEKTVNERGQLVIIENRERWINLVLGDRTGFTAEVQAPLRRIHKAIAPGETAELLILSRKSDLSRVSKITDAYLPAHNLWIGQYPYLRRDVFQQVSRKLKYR